MVKEKSKIKKQIRKKPKAKQKLAPAEVRFTVAAGMAGLGGPRDQF